jgi:hypothetical protein
MKSFMTSSHAQVLIYLLLALAAGLFYLALSAWSGSGPGFPLDDAWIHQTYARSLAESGRLAFVPGQPSAGSTAPLWTALLSMGYLLRMPFRGWAYGLGILLLGLTGWTAHRLTERLFPDIRYLGWWAGLFCLFEWHLVWAAVSGMETLLFVWLSLLLVERYLASPEALPSPRAALGLGLLGGLLVLTRPEGIGLVGLMGLDMARQSGLRRTILRPLLWRWLAIAAGLALLLLPYVLFHLALTGLPFPNTLYAKQAEYSVVLNSYPLWWRLFGNAGPTVDSVQGVFRVIFVGPQLLLLPGLVWAAWLTCRERRAGLWFIWGWWVSYLLVYGLRLPVTYQHGRYQIPAIVWVIILGVWGMARLVTLARNRRPWRVIGSAWVLSTVLLVAAFIVIGARAYVRDVRFIQTEMVAVAHWLDENVPSGAVLAVHDIGAIGYFTGRPLIDMAGLITPEIIPIIRDEAALYSFIQANRADYLVTFPSWYPLLIRQPGLERLYSPQVSSDSMTVYRLPPAGED